MRKRFYLFILACLALNIAFAQAPRIYSASDVYHEIEKLPVFGKVLYIAAHPDDENTRLLAYLANERKYTTAYLSITRGDGGQNLVGDEQGVELGLIRTQELLAARRIDGAQQFFTTAFDFGYSKSPEEAMRIWGHDKVLSDVVWIIRTFKPDVIITRFPTTGEGGHGHHTASAILASEAFDAAADSTKFPEQLKYTKLWQAKRLFWNTFNFGGNNTTREDQLKIDVGSYNAVLGKSYGEMAAESRSQHKSQGFGVASQRGSSIEYFSLIKGSPVTEDIMDGVDINAVWKDYPAQQVKLDNIIGKIKSEFSITHPGISPQNANALKKVFSRADELIVQSNGIFLEATVPQQLNAVGDSMVIQFTINNRNNFPLSKAEISCLGKTFYLADIPRNVNAVLKVKIIPEAFYISNPYFLDGNMLTGSYVVKQQQLIGRPESYPLQATFKLFFDHEALIISRPIQYKYTDPVKAELYEPAQIVYPAFVTVEPNLVLLKNNEPAVKENLQISLQANKALDGPLQLFLNNNGKRTLVKDTVVHLAKGETLQANVLVNNSDFTVNSSSSIGIEAKVPGYDDMIFTTLKKISYDHIPDIFYNFYDQAKIVKLDLKTAGKNVGYIAGAGDKVPQALQQMGYYITFLTEADITPANLKKFDAIVTGVRAYNIHSWLSNVYDVLMSYVENGGVLLNQYNTNNNIGPVKAKMAPYPFTISRSRITDETAKVNFLEPGSALMNYPNKISTTDFENWIQERSTYEATQTDARYTKYFSMNDPGEQPTDGSIITAKYGKGKYIYCGLVFFRELPAGVPGAFRLMANLLAPPRP